jgi:hypothetical protein
MGAVANEEELNSRTFPRACAGMFNRLSASTDNPLIRINFLVHREKQKLVQKPRDRPLRLANPALAANFIRRVLQA